ncbi:MAG: glutamine-hydrolyzing carbamoyl-phosphate synthase small subunit [Deltaproteobacteria bacterium]|nr:glutamine-hydrolyzing carbamoyl-phosphate synthase small subunit [Deltaproteobacteria bacterium]
MPAFILLFGFPLSRTPRGKGVVTLKNHERRPCHLILEDGALFSGHSFGAESEANGEVVFNTGMVGYPESFSDPSYRGQILCLTYPLIGNYGVPERSERNFEHYFESERVHISGLVVSEYSEFHHHWQANSGLSDWLREQNVPGIAGIDTRALTKHLREKGSMRGCIRADLSPALSFKEEQGQQHSVSEVSVEKPITYEGGRKRVVLVDCGCKQTIIKSLLNRGLTVIRVPWNEDVLKHEPDGVLFSNGPGDPLWVSETIENAKKVMAANIPTFGICLGNQIMALAAGAKTYKLKFGHRSQNQPCRIVGEKRCFITSQNHGYAVDTASLPADWSPWFENANDGTNEGIRHKTKSYMSVQFHPEAKPGPVDTGYLFDEFVEMI